jgi:hypothetical protein
MSSYEVASLSNVPSLSTAVLNAVINLSNLGLIATDPFSRNQAIYFDFESASSDDSREYIEL